MRVSFRLFAGLVSVKPKAGGDFKVVFIGAGNIQLVIIATCGLSVCSMRGRLALARQKDHGTYASTHKASVIG